MKLLQVLPAIAGKSQIRFASNFQTALLEADTKEIDITCWFVNFQNGDFISWGLYRRLSDVIRVARECGNDCQIFQVSADGNVIEL